MPRFFLANTRTLILLLVCFFGLRVFAAELPCQTADLYTGSNPILRGMPIHDQDGTGVCYAEAASVVASHYLIRTGQFSHAVVDPIFTGFVSKKAYLAPNTSFPILSIRNTPETLDSDSVSSTLSELRNYGFCGDAEVKSRLAGLMRAGNFTTTEQMLSFLDAAYRDALPGARSASAPTNLEAFSRNDGPNCNVARANQWLVAMRMRGLAQTEVLRRLFLGCELFHPTLPLPTVAKNSDANVVGLIGRSLLRNGPVALSISCFHDMAGHPEGQSVISRNQGGVVRRYARRCSDGQFQGHAVVAAGQKVINNQCHYLIRNSWGSTWRGAGATSCSCLTRRGQYKDNCTRAEARSMVGCWYKRADILNHIKAATTYE